MHVKLPNMLKTTLEKLVNVKAGEIVALLTSCAYFYLLLCSYYIIRPIRNEMVIENGVANIQWLLLFAALVMLAIVPVFGWLTSHFKTRQFLAYCTLFFASNLFIFFLLFDQNDTHRSIWISRGFYVWVNVFNMFIISLFWSFMNDVFSQTQSRRLFAFIAAGGTAGALTGPLITSLLVEKIGLGYLLLIAAIILSLTIVCINHLSHWQNPSNVNSKEQTDIQNKSIKGGVFDGIALILRSPYLLSICCFIILFALLSTFLSIQLAETIEHLFSDSAERTKLFSLADLATNVLTLLFQLSFTGKIINKFGYRTTLMLLPIGLTIGFLLLIFAPVLSVMIALSIFYRAGNYAIMKPTRAMLFTVVSRAEKYKAKNVIDTAVMRSGNVLSAWLYSGIQALGAGALGIAVIGSGLGFIWSGVSYWLGNQYRHKTPSADD